MTFHLKWKKRARIDWLLIVISPIPLKCGSRYYFENTFYPMSPDISTGSNGQVGKSSLVFSQILLVPFNSPRALNYSGGSTSTPALRLWVMSTDTLLMSFVNISMSSFQVSGGKKIINITLHSNYFFFFLKKAYHKYGFFTSLIAKISSTLILLTWEIFTLTLHK